MKKNISSDKSSLHGISIIMCCYNSEKRLEPTLTHIANQTLPPHCEVELIVVDNASSDNTSNLAMQIWDKLRSPFPIKIISEPTPGLAYARKTGVLNARFMIGIFCDDDNWLNSDYLTLVEKIFSNNSHIGVIGGSSIPFSDKALPSFFYSKANSFAVGIQAQETGDVSTRKYVWGAGMAIRLDFLKGLFSKGLQPLVTGRKGGGVTSGDDGEICAWFLFGGFRLWYQAELKFIHYMPGDRLTEEYYSRFFMRSYPTLWSTYSNYLIVRYFMLPDSIEFAGKIKNILMWLVALFHLITVPNDFYVIHKINRFIKILSKK